jgi:hypothetical protein
VSNPRRANRAQREKNRERMKAEGRDCWICRAFGRPSEIDYSLPARHPMSFELDELVPVSKYWIGGYPSREACALDYNNNDATHRCCNNWRKNKTVEEVLALAAKARNGKPAARPFVPREVEQPVSF